MVFRPDPTVRQVRTSSITNSNPLARINRSTVSARGSFAPDSYAQTAVREVPARSANSPCDSPARPRASAMRLEPLDIDVSYQIQTSAAFQAEETNHPHLTRNEYAQLPTDPSKCRRAGGRGHPSCRRSAPHSGCYVWLSRRASCADPPLHLAGSRAGLSGQRSERSVRP
jgi:hypothetical protein